MQAALALDVGGTHVKAGLVTRQGDLLASRESPMAASGGRSTVKACLVDVLQALQGDARRRKATVRAVGIGFPGTVHGPDGRVLTAPPQIPGVRGLCLAALAQEATGLPAVALNDADAATYGEARAGAGQGRDPVLAVTVGTGLGGGLVLNGDLLRGRLGTAGEIGQTIFRPERFPGPLGSSCRLEYSASATGLVRLWRRAGGARETDVRGIVAQAREGDARACQALARVGRDLGLGLANAALLVPPEVIVVGGGLAAAGRLLLDPCRAAFRAASLPGTVRTCRILRARLGNRAGAIGAGLLALQEA